MGKKRNSSPKQNTHDLLVGTLSIGIPSYILKEKVGYISDVSISDKYCKR